MSAALQEIVDGLASDIRRSVSLEDRHLRLLYYSAHAGPVDRTRYELLLTRAAPPEAVDYVLGQGAAEAREPLRILPNEQLGIEYSRICTAVRCRDSLLGFLLVIEGEQEMSGAERDLCLQAADAAGALLYRERVLHEQEHERERALLAALLSDDPERRAQAAAALDAEGLIATGRVQALALEAHGGEATQDAELALASALGRAARRLPPRSMLAHAETGQAVVLLAVDELAGGADAVSERLRETLLAALPDGAVVRTALGTAVGRLLDAHRSREQARGALRIAAALNLADPLVAWEGLGAYQLLAQIPFERLGAEALPPQLLLLFEADRTGDLALTAETYLELGGDAKATAAELVLHRASLYHRLQRIEAVTGWSLKDGDHRLALHLGLRLSRLTGTHPAPDRRPTALAAR